MGTTQAVLHGVKEIAKTLPSEFKAVIWAADEHIDPPEEPRRVEYTGH